MVILGRQGSGKGTQSLRLAAQYGCVHLSTGDVLRAAVEEGTELGRQAAGIMNACLLYTSPSPRDRTRSRMPSSA